MTGRSYTDTNAVPFDWKGWRQAFRVKSTDYWEVAEVFTAIAQETTSGGMGRLELDQVRALASPGFPDAEAAFRAYLQNGEFPALAAILELPALAEQRHTLEQELADHRNQFENRYGEVVSRYNALDGQLVRSGRRPASVDPSRDPRDHADRLRTLGRYGPALALMEDAARTAEVELRSFRTDIESRIGRIRGQMADKPAQAQQALRSLIEQAVYHLEHQNNDLAESFVRRAAASLEIGADLRHEEALDPATFGLRKEFPSQIRASHIVGWIEQGEMPRLPSETWTSFIRDWLPSHWERGMRPSEDSYNAIARFVEGSRTAPGNHRRNPWPYFLKVLFDLIGRGGYAPSGLEELAPLVRNVQNRRVGFWYGYCQPNFAIRGTFLDPERLSEKGLPVIVWHEPGVANGPSLASFGASAVVNSLQDRPLLLISDRPIGPDVREVLRSERRTGRSDNPLGNVALLDEIDILRIILCPYGLPAEAEQQERIRQMHLAATISRQLPAKQASPFSASGAARSTMFFGRDQYIRDLVDANGPTILYGGRKLGKSSIFREVERHFVEGKRETNAAIYLECGSYGQTAESILNLMKTTIEKLRDWTFAGRGKVLRIMDLPTTVDEFDAILRRTLQQNEWLRLLLLFDEADNLCKFVDVENDPKLAQGEQRLGWVLRSLVANFPNRFDVRFAGFQDIHRTAQHDQGPFFNFRQGQTSHALTVFAREEAIALLVQTLRGLDVEFDSPDLVERVLEFTGRHPALLQDFGDRLYKRLRQRPGRVTWRVTASDVDAVLNDPEFRREVVQIIHLNVSRPTREQRILRLLLYRWVQQMMAPEPGAITREARTAKDFFEDLCELFGDEVRLRFDVPAIDTYLRDLVVLGVLERSQGAYVFAYRSFASLLYHDHFGGVLTRQKLDEIWADAIEDTDTGRRPWIMTDHGKHTLSPLVRDRYDLLLAGAVEVPRVVLGTPDSGLTLLANWWSRRPPVDRRDVLPTAHRLVSQVTSADTLRSEIARSFGIEVGSTWSDLIGPLLNAARKMDHVLLNFVIDPLDEFAESDDLPLWFDVEPFEDIPDNLFSLAREMTRVSGGSIRFLFTGGLPTARLLIENTGVIGESIAHFVTSRLKKHEVAEWLEASRIIVPDEFVGTSIWDLSKGDWRLLVHLARWLKVYDGPGDVESNESHIREFFALIRNPEDRERRFPALHARVLDLQLAGLRALVAAARRFDIEIASSDDWAAAAHEFLPADSPALRWNAERWRIECEALALIGEIQRQVDHRQTRFAVVHDDPWLSLLV